MGKCSYPAHYAQGSQCVTIGGDDRDSVLSYHSGYRSLRTYGTIVP